MCMCGVCMRFLSGGKGMDWRGWDWMRSGVSFASCAVFDFVISDLNI